MKNVKNKIYACVCVIEIVCFAIIGATICFHVASDFIVTVRSAAIIFFFILGLTLLAKLLSLLSAKMELSAILAVTAAFYIVAFSFIKIELTGDIKGYYDRAWYFAHDRLYGLDYAAIFPHIIRYPKFISYFMRIFGDGVEVFFGVNLFALMCIVSMIYGLFKIGSNESCKIGSNESCKIGSNDTCDARCKSDRIYARIAALMIIFNPLTILYCLMPNSEILFGFCVFAAFFAHKALPNRSVPLCFAKYLTVGVFCAAANYFRPLGVIALIAVIMDLIFKEKSKTYKYAALIIMPFIIGAFLLNVQTESITGYKPVKTPYGWNLYVGASERGIWNEVDGRLFNQMTAGKDDDPDEVQRFFFEKGVERYKSMGLSSVMLFARKLSVFDIRLHVKRILGGILQTYDPDSAIVRGINGGTLAIFYFIFYALAFFGVIYGLINRKNANLTNRKEGNNDIFLYSTYIFGSLIIFLVLEAAPRHIVSYIPFLGLFIAKASEILIKRVNKSTVNARILR